MQKKNLAKIQYSLLIKALQKIETVQCPGKIEKVKWSEVKLLSRARLFATPWIVACTKLLHPWDFPGKSTGVGCYFLLQGIFPTQGSNPDLSHCRQTLYHLSHQGSPKIKYNHKRWEMNGENVSKHRIILLISSRIQDFSVKEICHNIKKVKILNLKWK